MSEGRREPQPGATATAEMTVEEKDLASAFTPGPGDSFPRVFATARMVALMEIAAARVLQPFLAEGDASVGVDVQTTHTAATPPGAHVRAHARYLGREGKLHAFEVRAEDEAGEIGRGTHRRAIVQGVRLEGSASRRRSG